LAKEGGFASVSELVVRFKEPENSGENEITNRTIHQQAFGACQGSCRLSHATAG
jgi:hypothetical protein